MIRIALVPVGAPAAPLMEKVSRELARSFGARCELVSDALDPAPAFHPERQQYNSTEILEMLGRVPIQALIVGITPLDLYIPILTYVFGEAELGGGRAVIGYHRLRNEFYGLPADPALLIERTAKEAIHETGHLLGLTHCDDWECVMGSTHSAERVDLKSREFCSRCLPRARMGRMEHLGKTRT